MKGIIVRSRAYSNYLRRPVLNEQLYVEPLTETMAIKLFKKEYPEYDNDSIETINIDSLTRPDLWNAFNRSGCIHYY